ncbi:tetratricopeptide repeat protein 4-like [Brevipalpus obovatus]|uniref:tetratricopeptide repeat protein 4-like n=1 Tax=Brevipalpus obovatus TaxID=246614 RepID=UPI003D9E6675
MAHDVSVNGAVDTTDSGTVHRSDEIRCVSKDSSEVGATSAQNRSSDSNTLGSKISLEEEDDDLFDVVGKYSDGWDENNWEKQMEEHPFFMSKQPEPGQLPPLLEGLAQIKYDEELNSKIELATSYKDDGNNNFKYKKYRWAIDCYSKGLELKCEDTATNATLLNNRAAAHFYLGNYRSSLNDALAALKIDENYEKAALRAAHCYFELQKFKECVDFCQKSVFADKLKEWIKKSHLEMRKAQRNDRKDHLNENKREIDRQNILSVVKNLGICVAGDLFRASHPAADGYFVHLESDILVWPVVFLYPECGQTDFIHAFSSNVTFESHLDTMFPGDDNHPPWDLERKYSTKNLKIAFLDNTGKYVFFNPTKKLSQVMTDKRFVITDSCLTFFVLPLNQLSKT